ncbi:MAG: hypothetical protein AAF290_06000 [Pseudomonadota bacterium]
MKKLVSICVVVIASIAIVACGKKDKPVAMADASGAALLTYVPADTPYVFAALEPMSQGFVDKMAPINNQLGEIMSGVMASAEAGAEGDEDGAAVLNFMSAMFELIKPETMAEFGFSQRTTSAIYGNGLLPVIRITLDETGKFNARFKQLAEEQGWTVSEAAAGGIDYQRVTFDAPVGIIAAEADGMAVVTVAPAEFGETEIATLLGAEKPANSLEAAGGMKALAAKYGMIPQGLGYFDMQRIAGVMIDGPSNSLDSKLFEMAGQTPGDMLTDVCKAEIKGLVAGAMSRIAFGYQAASEDSMDLLAVVEMREDLATSLVPIASAVPGLTADSSALMKFGIGLNLQGLRDFVSNKMGEMVENPYECAELSGLNDMAIQLTGAMQQPVPPIVYNFKGAFFELDNLDGIDLGSPSVPESLDANVVLAFDNVEGLIAMGQMMLPPLGMMELAADGEPVQIPQEMLTGYSGATFAAMTENLLAISTGNGAESNAKSLAGVSDAGEPVLMATSVDLAGYMQLIGDIQKGAMAGIEDIDSEGADAIKAMNDAQQKMTEAYAEIFDRETVLIKPTSNGIEIPMNITFK